ncbi:DUF4238 domain-containing protein [Bacillus velezensis]|uniref:DUF4238 domain-containing protein n=1 Tax=Bacillus velezensis TaxID=492670 RepID=UPI001642B3B2|nr:DUF4238 domain-containing protein [Bacillus velezensis]
MEKRNHHYISQFYLKGFLDERVIPPREPSLWVYDKYLKKLKQKGTKNVANINGYYDLKLITGDITTEVEEFFAKKIETPSAIILKKILNQTLLSDEERIQFSHFIYFSLSRVPNFLNYMTWLHRNTERLKSLFDVSAEIKEIVEETISAEELTTLELMIESSKIFVPFIYNMNWQFHIAPQHKYFLTSDNPVILNDPSQRKISPSFSGWNNPNIHLTLPLNSTMCLRATWGRKRKLYVKASSEFIRAINFRTAFFATRYIFSSRQIEPPVLNGIFSYNLSDIYESKQNWE